MNQNTELFLADIRSLTIGHFETLSGIFEAMINLSPADPVIRKLADAGWHLVDEFSHAVDTEFEQHNKERSRAGTDQGAQ